MLAKIVRRTHLYLALFLSPWLVMYALSTMAMNHRDFLQERYGPVERSVERELTYPGSFAEGTPPRDIARQILTTLDLDGAHNASRRPDGTIVINRQDLLTPRTITYTPATGRLVIEKMAPRADALLERFHRRRGYQTGYALDTTWAVTVDAVIVAIVAWVLSGLWMWWEMKATRRAGFLALMGGAATFALFLVVI